MKGDGLMWLGISFIFLAVFGFSVNVFLGIAQITLAYSTIILGDKVRFYYLFGKEGEK